MKVKALSIGEYPLGHWREAGEEFEFKGDKPGKWMEPLKGKKEKVIEEAVEEFVEVMAEAEAEEKPKPKAKPKKKKAKK